MSLEWPDDLPPITILKGSSERWPDVLIRTKMDAGPEKQRRRFTSAPTVWRMVHPAYSGADVARLESFWADDLSGGALPFAAPHPRGGDARSWRFLPSSIAVTPRGPDTYAVRFDLELLP